MPAHVYNQDFMRYAAQSSGYSARAIVSILSRAITIESVLDVGCATGAWLRAWSESGIADIHGIDGDYVDREMLEIPPASFTPVDLNAAFDLGRRFDLVQSLEVAEHIKTSSADAFVESLSRHALRFVLFAAAPPGQGGEYHINEQPYDFWRDKFEQRGFAAVDAIRPSIAANTKISYWYRYNTLLFVRQETLPILTDGFRSKIVPTNTSIQDVSPFAFRMRKEIVRRLPDWVQHEVARLKSKLLPTGRI